MKQARKRVAIECVTPEIDGGRFRAKRVVGDSVRVLADVFADGHDEVRCVVRYRGPGDGGWREAPMRPLGNDRWAGEFPVDKVGVHRYTIDGWVDHFASWRGGIEKKLAAGQDVGVDLRSGSLLVEAAAARARGTDRERLREWAKAISDDAAAALQAELAALMDAWPERRHATRYGHELEVWVDRERAGFSSWYELFPRSWSRTPGLHGTLRDVVSRLGYVAGMGFDVLYLPPIHPIGRTHRKGPNNRPSREPADIGSPWAIGGPEGGHDAIHPGLGTLDDFDALVDAARAHGLEVAMDLAFQCSPDHPWVGDHPEWFHIRPDGSVQYAENPPKRYEDIYPLNFETEAWESLWTELRRVVEFWMSRGVRMFRVDNPHTKAFAFWEWLIAEIHQSDPDVIFLSEAFTRPRVMYRLAKLGFTQSYTYFTWRTTKWELTEYFTELAHSEVAEYFRPNLWPNTPDILHEYLQTGGAPAFRARLVLAATLSANYGIYGPAFELCQSVPREPGSEEYLDSEKFQLRRWNTDDPDSLAELITRVNTIRRKNPALRADRSLRFVSVDNDQLIAYAKASPDGTNVIVCVVNLDPRHTQAGWVWLPPEDIGADPVYPYQVHDLVTDARYLWQGPRNFVELSPGSPAHVFRIGHHSRTEQDFEYFA